jgi:hypothetical protein
MQKGALKIEKQAKNPGKVSVGDRAKVYMATDVYNFLMEAEAGELPIGKDLHPMTTVPCGLAIDAATEACSANKTGIGTLRAMSFEMESPILPEGELIASAEVLLIGNRHVEVVVEVFQTNKLLLKGRIVLVRVSQNRATELQPFQG